MATASVAALKIWTARERAMGGPSSVSWPYVSNAASRKASGPETPDGAVNGVQPERDETPAAPPVGFRLRLPVRWAFGGGSSATHLPRSPARRCVRTVPEWRPPCCEYSAPWASSWQAPFPPGRVDEPVKDGVFTRIGRVPQAEA